MTRECSVIQLGLFDYREAYLLQKQLLCRRIGKKIPDTLVLLQHPAVITIGRKGSRNNILASPEELCREGILVYDADRGGDITYHGPGQLIAYPILDLSQHIKDVHRVIFMYEEVVIRLLDGYGVEGRRIPGYPGVWVENEKICAIGIGITNWVTYHGFALNVNTNLVHFSYISPCGITEKGVTSLERILGGAVNMDDVERKMVTVFGQVFDLKMNYRILEKSAAEME
ncbi:MAG: lipoyl(octanoyl) transferase LipB [Bacillota bacterium]